MAKYGIKVSQAGEDVAKTADKQLAFTSEATSLKIKKTTLNGAAPAVTITSHDPLDPPNAATVNVAHLLPYQPSFLIWCQDENKDWHFQNSASYGIKVGGPSNDVHATFCRTNLTDLVIQIINLSTSTTYTVGYHYMIMEDEA